MEKMIFDEATRSFTKKKEDRIFKMGTLLNQTGEKSLCLFVLLRRRKNL